ncbi:homoaconitase [Suillus variegatus]|nr:homoaconitase [Suillus variegatus]
MRLSPRIPGRGCLQAARFFATSVTTPRIPQTIIEKVVQKYSVSLPDGKVVKAGDYVMIRPEHVMTHDNTGPVISKFKSIGAKKIFDPRQAVFTLDHDVQNKSDKNLAKYANIEAFARTHGIDFYPAGRGIGHQVLVEEGYAFPHTLTVASDSHSNMYGGVACVDAAALWATGKTWWQVPRMVKVEFRGKLAPGVTGKDVIVALCGSFNNDEVLNAAIEFTGEGVSALSIDDRLTISNMTTEWGALVGVFPVDDTLLSWYESALTKLEQRTFASKSVPPPPEHPRINRRSLDALRATNLASDLGAQYSSHLIFDLSTLVPHVSGPNSVKVSTPLPKLESQQIAIQKAYLVSCTNSRVSDIAAAASVVEGKKVAEGVEFYVAAASSVVQAEAEKLGHWNKLIAAGAKVLPAGCGPCIGLGTGLLEEGETGISATNRNYKGRMGHPKAQAYLASPAVVAASAVKGFICSPNSLDATSLPPAGAPVFSIASGSPDTAEVPQAEEPLFPGFPAAFSGRLLFAPQDNLSTDALYPGKYTYQDGHYPRTPSTSSHGELRPHQSGVVLVSGYNFGTGSSREQAATALKAAGVPLVHCRLIRRHIQSVMPYNGLVGLECARGAGGREGELTVDKGHEIRVSMTDGNVTLRGSDGEKTYKVRTVGASVQELWSIR